MVWWVACAGALGALARFGVHGLVQSRAASQFPFGTVVVNVTGSFALGGRFAAALMGLIGVANGADGDLRPGLPVQMIEVHDPIRLLVIVEHQPEVVLRTIRSAPAMYEWYGNEWVHLMVIKPGTNEFFYFRKGEFVPYSPLTPAIGFVSDMKGLIESAKEMESNYIVDATRENLPVYSIH